MIVDFLRMMRSFMHKNNWEETKLFVSSVPSQKEIEGMHEYYWENYTEQMSMTEVRLWYNWSGIWIFQGA